MTVLRSSGDFWTDYFKKSEVQSQCQRMEGGAIHRRSTFLGELLRKKKVTHVFGCGLAIDSYVKFAVLECLKTGFTTSPIEDASRDVDLGESDAASAIQEIAMAGVNIVESHQLIGEILAT